MHNQTTTRINGTTLNFNPIDQKLNLKNSNNNDIEPQWYSTL